MLTGGYEGCNDLVGESRLQQALELWMRPRLFRYTDWSEAVAYLEERGARLSDRTMDCLLLAHLELERPTYSTHWLVANGARLPRQTVFEYLQQEMLRSPRSTFLDRGWTVCSSILEQVLEDTILAELCASPSRTPAVESSMNLSYFERHGARLRQSSLDRCVRMSIKTCNSRLFSWLSSRGATITEDEIIEFLIHHSKLRTSIWTRVIVKFASKIYLLEQCILRATPTDELFHWLTNFRDDITHNGGDLRSLLGSTAALVQRLIKTTEWTRANTILTLLMIKRWGVSDPRVHAQVGSLHLDELDSILAEPVEYTLPIFEVLGANQALEWSISTNSSEDIPKGLIAIASRDGGSVKVAEQLYCSRIHFLRGSVRFNRRAISMCNIKKEVFEFVLHWTATHPLSVNWLLVDHSSSMVEEVRSAADFYIIPALSDELNRRYPRRSDKPMYSGDDGTDVQMSDSKRRRLLSH